MKWLGIDWDGTGLLGIPADLVHEYIPELMRKEAAAYEDARG